MLNNCSYNICNGQRCVCTFDTHFKRRISLCYDEFNEVEVEKKITKEVIKQANMDYPRKTSSNSTPLRKNSPKTTPNRQQINSPRIESNINQSSTPNRPDTPTRSQNVKKLDLKEKQQEIKQEKHEEIKEEERKLELNLEQLKLEHNRKSLDRPPLSIPTSSSYSNVNIPIITSTSIPSSSNYQTPSSIPATQLITPPRSRINIHEVTPDRRRKEAIIKIKGKPVIQPMSRWSLDKL